MKRFFINPTWFNGIYLFSDDGVGTIYYTDGRRGKGEFWKLAHMANPDCKEITKDEAIRIVPKLKGLL